MKRGNLSYRGSGWREVLEVESWSEYFDRQTAID
jgi:hypothetical protein